MSALVDNGRAAATNGQETANVFGDDLSLPNRESTQERYEAGDASSPMHKSQPEPMLHRMEDILKDQFSVKPGQNADEAAAEEYLFQSRKSAFSPPSRLKSNGILQHGKSPCHSPDLSAPRDFRLRNSLHRDMSEAPSPDVLRGILQGKERPETDAFTNLLNRERELEKRLCRGGDYEMIGGGGDSENDSMDFGSSADVAFSDDSDGDTRQNGDDGRNSPMYGGDMNEEDSMSSNEESLEAKRARVENIISNMSPSKVSPDSGIHSQAEVKRPSKRKQYIPQQHGGTEEPPSKVPHMEKEAENPALNKQIRQMQNRLSSLQQNYSHIFPVNNNNDNRNHNLPEDQSASSPFITPTSTKYPQPHELIEMPKKSAHLLEAMDMDPNQFMKEANKVIESRLPKQQTSPTVGSTPADLEHLAKMLKTEITNSVGTLVDNIVSKFVEKQSRTKKSCLPSPIKPHSPVKPKNNVSTSSTTSSSTPSNRDSSSAQSKESKLVPENLSLSKPISPPASQQHFPQMKTSPRFEFPHDFHAMLRPPRTKMVDKMCHPLFEAQMKAFAEMPRPHLPLFPPPYFPPGLHPGMPHMFAKEPEQTEAMPLLVNTPKKKRTKVTDTRLSPRAARALLQETLHGGPHQHGSPHSEPNKGSYRSHCSTPGQEPDHFPSPFHHHHHHPPPLVPASLPTSVAIPNPNLQHSEVLAMYSHGDHSMFPDVNARMLRGPGAHSPSGSPNMGHTPGDMHMPVKEGNGADSFDAMHEQFTYEGHPITTTLTPMHLRKAKLMFFYSRYPSSSILKIYFPDVRFNKNNTAQLVKWFSNFREFYYIQMEKYARQSLAEGVKDVEDLVVTADSEIFRVLNLHYNRNNQIEVPENFKAVVQQTLREFYKSISGSKDTEQSWKKSIYKIIARLDDALPEYFKSPNWMDQLNES